MNSISEVLTLIAKLVYVFAFTFFKDRNSGENAWFLSICLFIGSALVFLVSLYQRSYYEAKTMRVRKHLFIKHRL